MPGKMSSDIDEEEDYSSIDERDPKGGHVYPQGGGQHQRQQHHQQQHLLQPRARQQQQLQQIHQLQQLQQQQPQLDDMAAGAVDPIDLEHQNAASAYVNLNEAKLSLDLNGDQAMNGGLKSSTRRDKSRMAHNRYARKSRSRERPRDSAPAVGSPLAHNPPALSSPINPGPLNFVGPADPERIRERERELEKIHRRSRELMLSPRGVPTSESRSRESSSDRAYRSSASNSNAGNRGSVGDAYQPTSGVSHVEGWKPAPPPPPPPPHQYTRPSNNPPPLPPRIHSPPGGSTINHRYKSPSPAGMGFQQNRHSHGNNSSGGVSFRRRVQSPNRRDFKDFSQHPREFRSPMRLFPPPPPRGSYLDDDDDSGADSLGNELNGGGCHHNHCGHCGQPRLPMGGGGGGGNSRALVPFGGFCHGGHPHHHQEFYCGSPTPSSSTSTALQVMPGVEERLLQLEGDKDSLHRQVALLSDQIDNQTLKIGDLERVLGDKKDVLHRTEDTLQRETLLRSSLETKKLELLSEISGLKLRQATLEKENLDLRKQLLGGAVGGAPEQRKSYGGGTELARGMRGVTVVDTVMTLPPSGRGGNFSTKSPPNYVGSPDSTSNSSATTLQTFGTMPRRSGNRRGANRSHHHKQYSSTSPPPLETHFDARQSGDEANCEKETWIDGPWFTGRKINNSHSGSAPSLVQHGTKIGFVPVAPAAPTVPRAARHQSVERAVVSQQQKEEQQRQNPPIATKPKGLKKFLGRMRRSSSGTIQEEKKEVPSSTSSETGHLRRGGFRSSAGSKFASWMGPSSGLPPSGAHSQPSSSAADPSLPFRQWKVETICSWLDHLGLYMYNAEVRKHIKIGEHLLALSSQDLETKLGMRSVLHRKKVLLALQAKQESSEGRQQADLPGKLDHQWVVRWLDDVGLPQYKDAFLEARVDGRVLNFLTVEDLFQLKVTNLLHHLSIRRGIQVLRQNDFEPSCLRRRAASPEERDRSSSPPEVSLWTSHRVMEWLRHVDLAEYAPNLRGSGVHGGLLVLEPKFTPDLLAALLSIPPAKTLLRRHLSLHFRDVVGPESMREKRAAEEEPNHVALTPTTRVKPQKRGGGGGAGQASTASTSQFSLRRRRFISHASKPDELDFDDMVCPLNEGVPSSSNASEAK